ncbi:hypothetical protein WR25_26175 [Diploscapter pachys]|uniref:BRICHOS domain-containing protein n=1 Tax=Diploscapter pachys TaxID=2018661 RepID=A0A2A2J6P4_9BILA|nr:hypothetical protein WR25_26175 [Diploscapter pachys]
MDRPRRSVEQIEIIDHQIIEERRPSTGAPFVPTSTVRTTRETYETRGDDILDRRFEVTGERDVSRDASFLHSSANAGHQIEISPARYNFQSLNNTALNTSVGSRGFANTNDNTIINNYGYDVHEVHTTEGGARVVETHGGGPVRDVSRLESTRVDEVAERPGISSAVRNGFANLRSSMSGMRSQSQNQVFTVPSPPMAKSESWRHVDSEHDSFNRQGSYRKMQLSDEMMQKESSRAYAPQSQTSLVSRRTRDARSEEGCWARTKNFVKDVYWAIRNAEMTPRLMANLCCILLLLLLLLILIFIMLRAIFARYGVTEFLLYPPVCESCRKTNPAYTAASLPSSVYVHFYSSSQAHMELRGNQPFKSNSFTAIDFSTGFIAIADHALTDANGRHTTCFIMPLDRTALPSMDALWEAVGDSDYEVQSNFGWQEYWNFNPTEMDPVSARSKFTDTIEDCVGAKWYFLQPNVHGRDVSCSNCYDFCLPDWAVVRKEKYEDYATLGIRRLDCFRLDVPEWRNFRVETDMTGGHFQYPLSSESTKRDSGGNWMHWIPTQNAIRTRRKIDHHQNTNATLH